MRTYEWSFSATAEVVIALLLVGAVLTVAAGAFV